MSSAARILNGASIALLAATVVAGMALGSGASATSRLVIASLSGVTLIVTVIAMAASGRFRLLKSPLWISAFLFAALGIVQVAPMPLERWIGPVFFRPAAKDLADVGALNSADPLRRIASERPQDAVMASYQPHATLQWIHFAIAGGIVLFVAAHQLRTVENVRHAVAVLLLAATASGILGAGQTIAGQHHLFGFIRVKNPDFPSFVRDIYAARTAIGPTAYQPWNVAPTSAVIETPRWPTSDSADWPSAMWYSPSVLGRPLFAGFLSVSDWSACIIALLPIALAAAVFGGTTMNDADMGPVFLDPEGPGGLLIWSLAALSAGIAAWFGDPLAVALAVVSSSVVWFLLAGKGRNWPVVRVAGGTSLLVGVVAIISLHRAGGVSAVIDRLQHSRVENVALVQALYDHLWLGAGFGSLPDVWPLYRGDLDHATIRYSSSLLALVVEVGLAGAAIVGLSVLYVSGRWLQISKRLDPDSRGMTAGAIAGLIGLATFGLAGPGLEAPIAFIIATVLTAVMMRGLAFGYWTNQQGVEA